MEYKMEYRLTDLCELIMGQSPDSSSCNKDGKGIPFYQGNADFGEKNPTPRNWCLQPKKIAQKDDILISVRAPIGDLNIANEDCCIGRGVAAIRMKSKECDRDYLYLFLESKSKYLQDCGTGSTFTAINKGVLESLKVKCPELKNQTSIANEIENIKAAIKYKNSELICLNEAVQSEFVEMFGENPVESGKWKVETLGEIGKVSMCKRILREQTTPEGDIPFYKIGTFGKKADAYISKELYNEFKSRYSYPKKGSILISASGTIGRAVVFDGEPAYFQDSNIVWIDNDETKVLNSFLQFWYGTNPWKITQGGTISRLYNSNISEANVIIPPLEVQQSFAAFVQKIDKSKFVLQQQLQFIKKYVIMTSWRKICFYTTVAM